MLLLGDTGLKQKLLRLRVGVIAGVLFSLPQGWALKERLEIGLIGPRDIGLIALEKRLGDIGVVLS